VPVIESDGQKLVIWGDLVHVAAVQFREPCSLENRGSRSCTTAIPPPLPDSGARLSPTRHAAVTWMHVQIRSLIPITGFVLVPTMAAVAQLTSQVSDNQQVPSSGVLEEIVVTAQKRAQNQQNVPVSVASFSADMLASANVTKITDLSKLDPSLVISAGAGELTPFIRGSGTLINNVGDESSVAVYLVPRQRDYDRFKRQPGRLWFLS
jgi:hypothetical protein